MFLPGELFEQVKKQARKRDMTHSEFLRETIASGMGFKLEVKNDHGAKSETRKTRKKVEAV